MILWSFYICGGYLWEFDDAWRKAIFYVADIYTTADQR
jgi:hypothetical protein